MYFERKTFTAVPWAVWKFKFCSVDVLADFVKPYATDFTLNQVSKKVPKSVPSQVAVAKHINRLGSNETLSPQLSSSTTLWKVDEFICNKALFKVLPSLWDCSKVWAWGLVHRKGL